MIVHVLFVHKNLFQRQKFVLFSKKNKKFEKNPKKHIFSGFLGGFLVVFLLPTLTLRGSVLRIRIRDLESGAFLIPGPGSGIRSRFFSGSRIPDFGSLIPHILRAY
jgi:hypothetical protein